MNIEWTQVILAVIGLAGAILTGVVIPYIRVKTTKEQRESAYIIIQSAVWAADQLLKNVDPSGHRRNEYVMSYIEGLGLGLTEKDINMLIESAVHELNLAQQKLVDN